MDRNNFSELENQSWENMQILLDKEMPVEKDRNIYFLYFVLVLVLSSFVALTLYFLHDRSSTENSLTTQSAKEAQIVLIDTSTSARRDISKLEMDKRVKSSSSDQLIQNNNSSKKNKALELERKEKKSMGIPSTSQLDTSLSKVSKSKKKNPQSFKNTRSVNITPVQSTKRSKNKSHKKSKLSLSEKWKSRIIQASPSVRTTNSIKTLEWTPKIIEFHARALKKMNASTHIKLYKDLPIEQWSFSIATSFSSNLDWKDIGVGLIPQVSYKVFPALSIDAGIGFFRYSLDTEGLRDIDFENEINESTSEAEMSDFKENVYTLIQSYSKQTQLVSNLGISKSFFSQYAFSVGLKYRHIIRRSSTSSQDSLAEMISNSDLSKNDILRNHFFNPYVSFSYTLTDKFSLHIASDFSSLSYFKQATNPILSRKTSFIQTEISYKF